MISIFIVGITQTCLHYFKGEKLRDKEVKEANEKDLAKKGRK
jgi:hypothetical protein